MGDIRSRMNLYGPGSKGAKEAETKAARKDKKEAETKDTTKDVTKTEIKIETKSAPARGIPLEGFSEILTGVLYRKILYEDLQFGARRQQDFYPLELSGIFAISRHESAEEIHPAEVLFLDTETTGLSRGTGVIPFLTGFAWISGRTITIEQFFLEDPGNEEAYLELILSRLTQFPYIASYNGKSFDIPLLRSRMILNRTQRMKHGIHFDLYHIFRRLLPGKPFGSYSQPVMECQLLEHCRDEKVTGADVPQIYFDFLRYGQNEGLQGIIEHNTLDMQGLVFLLFRAIEIYRNKDTKALPQRSGLAKILHENRNTAEAIALLQEPDRITGVAARHRYRDLFLLAHLLRKEKQYEESYVIFNVLHVEFACLHSAISAARIQEHRLKDILGALELTKKILRQVEDQSVMGGALRKDNLEKRLSRLQKKAVKH